VKETIQAIRHAGVKVWMLTGDKKETAINIGVSCGLVETDMAIVTWDETVEKTYQTRQEHGSRNCCLVATGEDLLKPVDEHLLL
jgi:magnesium-transporting ATPase (P-type)